MGLLRFDGHLYLRRGDVDIGGMSTLRGRPASFGDLVDTEALALSRTHGFSFYDSLIVASALEAGCDTLLTEDLQTGRRIVGLTIVDPFS